MIKITNGPSESTTCFQKPVSMGSKRSVHHQGFIPTTSNFCQCGGSEACSGSDIILPAAMGHCQRLLKPFCRRAFVFTRQMAVHTSNDMWEQQSRRQTDMRDSFWLRVYEEPLPDGFCQCSLCVLELPETQAWQIQPLTLGELGFYPAGSGWTLPATVTRLFSSLIHSRSSP